MRQALAKCGVAYGYLATRLRGVLTSRRGQAGVITAILAPVIIGAAALAIDAALWQVNQRSQQGAADQAAIAGMNAYILSGDNGGVATDPAAQKAALAVALSFGYAACTQSATGCPCTPGSYGACAGLPEAIAPADTLCTADPTKCLQVTVSQPQQRFLSQVAYGGTPIATASATTYYSPGGACVLALDQAPNPLVKPPSVSLGGSSKMELNACNLVNNLNDPGATQNDTDITGNSILDATKGGGQILLAQTKSFFGTGQVTPPPVYGTSPMPDPYANRAAPCPTSAQVYSSTSQTYNSVTCPATAATYSGCTYPGPNNTTPSAPPFDNTKTITSNTTFGTPTTDPSGTKYTVVFPPSATPTVFCGGLNMTSGNLYLSPGIYIMDGGGFTASGNSVIYGSGVTIYVTCDTYYTNLTKDPITGSKISPNPTIGVGDCSKNYGSISITGTAGSCPGSEVCDAIGYCESQSACVVSTDCSNKTNNYCSHPAGTFYGDVSNIVPVNANTINNIQPSVPSSISVGNAISGLGIPTGATITGIINSVTTACTAPPCLTISSAATDINPGDALQGPGFCSSACTGSQSAPKVTLSAPPATSDPPTGTAGMSIWVSANAPVGATDTFTGDTSLNINGAVYAPNQAVTYEGGQASTSTCSQLISLTINMSGGHDTTFSQAGCGVNSGVQGHGVAKLVE